MTEIDFYTDAADKLQIACRLSAKAMERGLRVWVHCPDADTTHRLDRLMWAYPATGFIPHCRADASGEAETPVIIEHLDVAPTHQDVLVNLHPACPPFYTRFQRLIEIVGLDETDLRGARERYRHYRDRGYAIRSHSLGKD